MNEKKKGININVKNEFGFCEKQIQKHFNHKINKLQKALKAFEMMKKLSKKTSAPLNNITTVNTAFNPLAYSRLISQSQSYHSTT